MLCFVNTVLVLCFLKIHDSYWLWTADKMNEREAEMNRKFLVQENECVEKSDVDDDSNKI